MVLGRLKKALTPAEHRQEPSPPEPAAPTHVVVISGPNPGAKAELSGQLITIGRADDSTLVVPDHYASKRHCRLTFDGEEWLLEDVDSTNGTYLDRGKINAPTPVTVGLPIWVGGSTLELQSLTVQ